MKRLLFLSALLALLAGCCSVECETERLPHQGVTRTSEQLFEVVQHAAKHECYEVLYDCASAKTREEYSYLEFRIAFPSIDMPEPFDMYEIQQVVSGGELLGIFDGPRGREVAIVEYQEPDGPLLSAQILVVEEEDEELGKVKRLGLLEQVEQGPPLVDPLLSEEPRCPAPVRRRARRIG